MAFTITNLQNKIGVECNAYLYDLVSVPMYYYILNELSEDGTFDFSQYVNRYQIINRLFQKAYVHGANRYRERKAYEIAVWLIFPWLSYQVALEHTAWPNQKGLREKIGEFLKILCKVQDSELIEAYQRAVGLRTVDGTVCSFFREKIWRSFCLLLKILCNYCKRTVSVAARACIRISGIMGRQFILGSVFRA